jgi:hypothetical protein
MGWEVHRKLDVDVFLSELWREVALVGAVRVLARHHPLLEEARNEHFCLVHVTVIGLAEAFQVF